MDSLPAQNVALQISDMFLEIRRQPADEVSERYDADNVAVGEDRQVPAVRLGHHLHRLDDRRIGVTYASGDVITRSTGVEARSADLGG
jgi:hypothetical protein